MVICFLVLMHVSTVKNRKRKQIYIIFFNMSKFLFENKNYFVQEQWEKSKTGLHTKNEDQIKILESQMNIKKRLTKNAFKF